MSWLSVKYTYTALRLAFTARPSGLKGQTEPPAQRLLSITEMAVANVLSASHLQSINWAHVATLQSQFRDFKRFLVYCGRECTSTAVDRISTDLKQRMPKSPLDIKHIANDDSWSYEPELFGDDDNDDFPTEFQYRNV